MPILVLVLVSGLGWESACSRFEEDGDSEVRDAANFGLSSSATTVFR